MKKIIITTLLLSFILIAGCVNYKTYDDESITQEDLIKEIEAIEKEIELEAKQIEKKTVEEVIILDEKDSIKKTQIVRVKENEKVTLKPKVSDPDNDKITLTYSKPLNQMGEWKTNYGDAGEYSVTITATDGNSKTSKEVTLVVEKNNVAPIIEELKEIVAHEGEVINFKPKVSDPNGDKVTVTISKPLDLGVFKTNHKSEGIYQITVIATDGDLKTEKTFTLTVKDVNQKPEIKDLGTITIKEGETLNLKPEVSDKDGDKVTVSISEPVGDDGVWKLSYTDNGEYLVTVTANDGKDTVSKQVKIIVQDVNAPVEFVDIAFEIN